MYIYIYIHIYTYIYIYIHIHIYIYIYIYIPAQKVHYAHRIVKAHVGLYLLAAVKTPRDALFWAVPSLRLSRACLGKMIVLSSL